ncbi:hypothetical protein DMP23_24590 [Amycolatopsis sp. A1MSW2902]
MGSNWSWTLALPEGSLTTGTVEQILEQAETAGLSPIRPGGGCNGFDNAPGHEGEHRVVDRDEMVRGLVTGSWATNLWTGSETDIGLNSRPGRGRGWDQVRLDLDSVHSCREPSPRAQPFRDLHRLLTGLWLAVAARTGAFFGRVEDEWSLTQIWAELTDPLSDAPPPVGVWPRRLGWWTYFDADRYRLLPTVPTALESSVRRIPEGAAVIELLTDPAAVDPVRFSDLHHDYWRGIRARSGNPSRVR